MTTAKTPESIITPAPAPADPGLQDAPGDRGKAPPKAGRPEWLPEKFKAPEDLAKSYTELETWKGKKEDEIREALKAEVEAGLHKDRPEAAEKYELPKFEDARVDHDALAAHPLVGWWRDKAFTRGLSQAEFAEGIQNYVNALSSNAPKLEDEIKKIGENADIRMKEVSLWAQKQWTDPEEFNAVQQIATTAAGFKAIERLMRGNRGTTPPPSDLVEATPAESEGDIKRLMASREYWDPARRDPKVVERVQNFYARQYGKKK